MVSFSPNDVIFVLNKWDSLCLETELKKQRYIEKAMEAIRNIWKEVDDSCILKLSVNIGYFRVDFVLVLTFVVLISWVIMYLVFYKWRPHTGILL